MQLFSRPKPDKFADSSIQEELIFRINQSKVSLKIAVTWLTNKDIFEAILSKLDNPEYQVTLIVLNDCINNKREGVNFQKIIDKKGNFLLLISRQNGTS